ncbi:MAG: phenylalanine--tRNA ligase subunit alpha [Chlamydiae bacterium CG10_big_fil_rev_8_21_14_0_10_35_9]|nr:MAG: phenylalanine--tRNA ligase subunit alpha [Chlamydiae bacterium CG10_big_fil_rev_8_21_14_0_10_35_9]
MSLLNEIEELRSNFLIDLKSVETSQEVETLKVKYLGKKGPIQQLMMALKTCEKDQRPKLGQLINSLKQEFSSHCESSLARLNNQEQLKKFTEEKIDITLPGRRKRPGRAHPITQMLDRCISILKEMGFAVQHGPDVDSVFYNFEGLNFPPDHPAMDMQDTFWISDDMVLRTHTSNVQVRVMEANEPPIRVIAPGRCFRNETISARSHVFFHQIEGFYIDAHVSFADLLATMNEFWSKLFNRDVQTRFRPSYFPFVEPGMEVDIKCTCKTGCRICKYTGWLEVCGAGMIHPEVLKSGGIDPEKYSGYAWGMGIERLALLEYDIPDIRMFTENDIRFLQQFS